MISLILYWPEASPSTKGIIKYSYVILYINVGNKSIVNIGKTECAQSKISKHLPVTTGLSP